MSQDKSAFILENFTHLIQTPQDVEKLNAFILQLAVRGKLVPRIYAEGNSKTLIQQISQKRNKQIKVQNQNDYDLPIHWVMTRLGDVTELIMGQSPPGTSYNEEGIGEILINGPAQFGPGDYGLTIAKKFTTEPTKMCNKGDVLYCVRASIGRTNIASHKACIGRGVAAICPIIISKKYLHYYLIAYRKNFFDVATGSTFKSVSIGKIKAIDFPLPPIEEQQRIVNRVEELFAQTALLKQKIEAQEKTQSTLVATAHRRLADAPTAIDLENAWIFLRENFEQLTPSSESIQKIRETILQLAVRGKLVEQDEGDESVNILIKNIKQKKTDYESSNKSRKTPPYKKYLENKSLHMIPKTWQWVRLGDVTINRDSERIPLSRDSRSLRKGKYDYYGASGVIDHIDAYLFNSPLLLIGEDGANLINRSTPIAYIASGQYWVNNHAHVLDSYSLDCLNYLSVYINGISLEPYLTGIAQPKLNQAYLNSIPIAFPPLEEQKHIVARVEELFALCDQLETKLAAALSTQSTLTQDCLLF